MANYNDNFLWSKIKRKTRGIFLRRIANTFLQFKLYPSYWHRLANKGEANKDNKRVNQYMCLKPNYGAGIGHQLANWNAGLYFAGYYGLKFAHFPFSNKQWESFLGFGHGEVEASDLINDSAYKKVRLPRFDSDNPEEVKLIGEIIASYKEPNILFILEMDQGYMRQYETFEILSDKFFQSPSRKEDKLIYNPGEFNIAVHVRRGDIVQMKDGGIANWKDRWLDNEYFVAALKNALHSIKVSKPVRIFLFSQGKPEDFRDFEQFDNLVLCLEMGPIESFLHMTNADLLISSKSSFSYKPALINKGIKICPGSFWHQYPATEKYVLTDDDGNFDKVKLSNLLI